MKNKVLSPYVFEDLLTGSNCYIIEEEGHVIVIDPNDHRRILKLMKYKSWVVDYILLTHEHCDHMQGLNDVRNAFPAAKVIASTVCSENLRNRVKNMSGMMGTYLYFKHGGDKKYVYASIVCSPAHITFQHHYTFHWRGHEVKLVLVPGHTLGSVCIRMDDMNLFSGDYLILDQEDNRRLPGGDEEAYQRIGKPWLESLPTGIHVFPGHGKDYDYGV